MAELAFMSVTDAFNHVGAVKADGSAYRGVRGVSVAATRRHFRFWENDILHHTDAEMELRRPAIAGPDWRFSPPGRSFYLSLVDAMNASEPIFVTINRRGEGQEGGTVIARDAAPVMGQSGQPAPGRVLFVNPETGELRVILNLGGIPTEDEGGEVYADQFTVTEAEVTRLERSSVTYSRNREVRGSVLTRASGNCERCGIRGFFTSAGIYLETHHVVPLSESGRDATDNVVALCPNCHKAAHFSLDRGGIRQALERRLRELALQHLGA